MSNRVTANVYLTCPLCDADVSLTGDETVGDQIMCVYCECPLKIKISRDDDLYLVEDF